MPEVTPSLSVINLNLNGLNSVIKRYRWAEGIKTHGLTICCPLDTLFKFKDTNRWKVKVWK